MTDRGRDTSSELTEVRTVLSRAIEARLTLWRFQTRQFGQRGGRWDYSLDPPQYVGGTTDPDPDVDDMIEALDAAIVSLLRWRRTGRARKPPRLTRILPYSVAEYLAEG